MKNHHQNALRYLVLMVGALILAGSACKKSPTTIGDNLLDQNNYIGVFRTDTTEIVCYSYLDDSISTKNVSYALLGSTLDPVFGLTQAGFYTQFHLSTVGHNFGESPVLDSAVLQLYISSYYGDTMTMQTVHAYELTDTLSSSSTYCNFSEVAHNTTDHANSFQFYPRPLSSFYIVGTDTIENHILRIPLSQELGNYLINLDSSYYSSVDLFKQHFKGLYVTCDAVSQNGAISSFTLTNNSLTALQLYYHNAATPEKAMRYDLYVTSSDVYFNHYDHDYTLGSPEFRQQVVDGDITLGSNTIYAQTMGGVRTRIIFPNLEHWADTLKNCHIIINEAKLILTSDASVDDSSFLKSPTSLILVGQNEDGTTYVLPDYLEGSSYYGGTYTSATRTAFFRISEYMQSIIMKKKPNNGISLGINGASYNATRWVMNGNDTIHGDNKLRVEVTYSLVGE